MLQFYVNFRKKHRKEKNINELCIKLNRYKKKSNNLHYFQTVCMIINEFESKVKENMNLKLGQKLILKTIL